MKKKAELSLEVAKEMYKSGGVAKQFALDNYTEQELTTREVKCWGDLEEISGWYIQNDCTIKSVHCVTMPYHNNIFNTKEQAEAAIAMAMLSQLMKDVNGDWVPDWTNERLLKQVIFFNNDTIASSSSSYWSFFLAFPTAEIRDKFLENHRELIEKAKPLL